MAMDINKEGVFSGAEFSTTDFNTNPTLDNGPFSSPEDHGAKPQKQPFPNTNWVPADDENKDEQPYSNVASSFRPFSKKAAKNPHSESFIDKGVLNEAIEQAAEELSGDIRIPEFANEFDRFR